MLTKELLFKPRETVFKLKPENGGEVKIRKLKASEILRDDAEDENKNFSALLISVSLVEPKLSYEEARELSADTTKELIEKITDYNGMSEAAKGLEKK